MGELVELPTPLVLERKARELLHNDEEVLRHLYEYTFELSKVVQGMYYPLCRGPIANILEWLELRARVESKAKGRLQ